MFRQKSINPSTKNKEPKKNEEEQTDIEESENEVITSKFNFKNEVAKPTIQNFSSYAEKKVESKANEDDEIKIEIENLTYWNVDTQEAYYSYVEASKQREKK